MEEEKEKNFQEIFNEAIKTRGFNLNKIAEETGVPIRHLTAISAGDFKKLPPAPYVRGYLLKIAEVLGIDGDELWHFYKEENLIKRSGEGDAFPVNRFALKSLNKKKIFIGIILFFGIIYLIFRIDDLLGIPDIKISIPEGNSVIVHNQFIKLTGYVSHKDKLMINNEEIFTELNGHFEKDFQLQEGANAVEFRVKRFLGKEIKVVKEIIYQPQ